MIPEMKVEAGLSVSETYSFSSVRRIARLKGLQIGCSLEGYLVQNLTYFWVVFCRVQKVGKGI